MLDPLTRARMLGQPCTLGMRQAARTGVPRPDLRAEGGGFHYVITVEDNHRTGTAVAVALEGPLSMDEQRTRAGRLRRYVSHGRRDHLHRRQYLTRTAQVD